jgi:secreted trypsin-like serine protease
VAVQPVTVVPDPSLLVMGIVYNGSDNSDVQICSGTLVDPTHLLTAGHCACGNPTSYRIFPTYSIYPPGKTDIQQAGLNTNSYRSKVPVAFDPRLCGGGRISGNDLALLELAELSLPISSMNFGAPPYTLLHELTKGEKLSVVGYGYNGNNTIGFRYKDKIPIMSVACTERVWMPYCASFAEMVLGEAPGAGQRDDTCGGDSGGPVFQSSDFGYALLAVTSRAAPGIQDATGKNCGGGGIYTLAGRDSVQQWLKANGVQPVMKIGAQ